MDFIEFQYRAKFDEMCYCFKREIRCYLLLRISMTMIDP